MNTDQKLTHQWEVINHISDWIQAADNKAGISLAIIGIIAGFLFTSAFELARSPGYSTLVNDLGLPATIALVAGVLALCFSSGSAFLCLTARTGVHIRLKNLLEPAVDRPSTTLIFFGRIAQYKREDYVSAVTQSSDSDTLTDLAEQIHVLSCIATEKYRWLNKVYIGISISLICFLLLAIVTLL
jgi:hypothetical protein